MLELPDFAPLRVTFDRASRRTFDSLDHLLIVSTQSAGPRALQKFPQGRQLGGLLARARERGDDFASSRVSNTRATGLTVAAYSTQVRVRGAELGEARGRGVHARQARGARHRIRGRARRSGRALPRARRSSRPPPRRRSTCPPSKPRTRRRACVHFSCSPRRRMASSSGALAQALGNNLARWLTALPPNVLNAAAYRERCSNASPRSTGCVTASSTRTSSASSGAGAFLAVSQGNPRPRRRHRCI